MEHVLVTALARRRRPSRRRTEEDRGIVSPADWRRPAVRLTLRLIQVATLLFLLVVGLGPLLWMAKSSVTPTQDTLRAPMALWPNGIDLGQFATAWTRTHIDRYLLNTVWIAIGSWIAQIVVATTAGYALSVLRPRFHRLLTGLVLATLFVPSIVLLVPLYLTVVDVPIAHLRLIDTFWAVWLPAGASAFNVIVIKRFFDNLPREIFEAARVDGAGPFQLFWQIVLPMSRPIIGVVSVFAVIATWKDYLWPLLVLRNPSLQPLSVRLPTLEPTTDLGVFIAALTISSAIPIGLFLLFQRLFLRGPGLSG
ncbi:MAG TPA: carbohydrate ABC transporter permease, partial [Candidatus Limnocylindrales bacterium]|nr:carbohydrate ABC transporter permease [Candidatus Limnocylindrales bacterium]